MKILVIEDNPDIVANLYEYLEPRGHQLDNARNGYSGLALASEHQYDVIILDGMLPGLDGLDVCRRLREELDSECPILMLTARDSIPDRVAGLEAGADDYLIKPFSLVELDARLMALVRRSCRSHQDALLRYADLEFNQGTFEVKRHGQRIELTPIGYKILAPLMRAAPKVVTREELERQVWNDEPPMSDALRTHVHALRQAIDKAFPQLPPLLVTVSGIGYRLVNEGSDH